MHHKKLYPEYEIWQAMKKRCSYKKSKHYKNYGGRGIRVCKRWLNSFENFYADMGSRPSSKYSIDRINNDGDYKPSNCRWATRKEQCNNTRQNHIITYNGVTLTMTQWARKIGLTRNVLKRRLALNWSVERSLNTPFDPRKRLFTKNGNTFRLSAWCKKLSIKMTTVYGRLRRGWSIERALFTKARKINRAY